MAGFKEKRKELERRARKVLKGFVLGAVATAGAGGAVVSCVPGVGKGVIDKATAKAIEMKMTDSRTFVKYSGGVSPEEFEKVITEAGYKLEATIESKAETDLIRRQKNIYDDKGNSVGAYTALTKIVNGKGQDVKLGKIMVNKEEEKLQKAVESMGVSREGDVTYKFNPNKDFTSNMKDIREINSLRRNKRIR